MRFSYHHLNPFTKHPKALLPLFLTELWERFSFYGIRPLIILLLAASVQHGGFGFDHKTAAAIAGLFAGMVYFFALPGGWIADRYLGQAKAVWWGSILIACGHLFIALSAWGGHPFFFIGLMFIAVGSGLFKTCMSVLVGRLYAPQDPKRDGGYLLFYMGINIGSLAAPIFTGLIASEIGWHWGFGIGGLGMLIALITYRVFAQKQVEHLITPHQIRSSLFLPLFTLGVLAFFLLFGLLYYWLGALVLLSSLIYILSSAAFIYFIYLLADQSLNQRERKQLIICAILFIAASIFWAALEQQPVGLTLFIQDYVEREYLNFTIPSSWFYALNPLFIIIFAPLLNLLLNRWSKTTVSNYLIKAVVSLTITAFSFLLLFISAKHILATEAHISPVWIIVVYALQAIAELMISPVGLAAISLLAPQKLQGQMMGFWFISSAIGNLISGKLGGNINSDQLDMMPYMFGQTGLWLIGTAVIIAMITTPIARWVAQDRKASTSLSIIKNGTD